MGPCIQFFSLHQCQLLLFLEWILFFRSFHSFFGVEFFKNIFFTIYVDLHKKSGLWVTARVLPCSCRAHEHAESDNTAQGHGQVGDIVDFFCQDDTLFFKKKIFSRKVTKMKVIFSSNEQL